MEKKELSMEVRLLIAFVLMGLVIVWQYSMRPLPTPPPAKAGQDQAKQDQSKSDSSQKTSSAIPVPASPSQGAAQVEAPGQVQAGSEEIFAVETDVFRVRFSNRGGVVKSWLLKNYKDHAGQPLELVN